MDFYKNCTDLYEICHIPISIVNQSGTPLLSLPSGGGEFALPEAVQYVLTDFFLQKRDALHPLVTYLEPGYFLGVVELTEKLFCIVGLVSPFQHTRSEIMQVCAQGIEPQKMQAFCDLMIQMPMVNLYQLKSLICLLVRLANEAEITFEDILFVDNTVFDTANLNDALFELREDADFHVPIDYETGVCGAIEAGDTELLKRRMLAPSQGKVGRMSSNAIRQQKYAFISFATLLTRAAIRGGLSGEIAFNLSDVYCQRMDVQTEIAAVEQLAFTMTMDFCRRVAETKNGGVQSDVVKKCIAYISAHLHENLSVEELSRHCGLCGRSLSIKFKAEVGYGIPEYIHREKLCEARYLLTSTDYSLADIAGFLNYPTQSYFTQIFKKYEGQTPQQYRDNPNRVRR